MVKGCREPVLGRFSEERKERKTPGDQTPGLQRTSVGIAETCSQTFLQLLLLATPVGQGGPTQTASSVSFAEKSEKWDLSKASEKIFIL